MGGVKVTFNSGVRYSQWAINSRANDFYANTKPFGLATYNADGTPNKQRKDTKNKLDYVPGLVAKSMIEAADYYQDFTWSKPWFLSVKEYGDTYSNSVPTGGGSLDDLNAVKLYIGLYNNANAIETDKSNYKNAIGRAQTGLETHNTKYAIKSGTLAGENGKVTIVGEGETNIVATIKPTETNKYKETSATFAVKVEKKQTPESGVIYDFTTSVGTTSYGTSCTTDNNVIKFSSNFSANEGKYITIKPNNGGFKAGDVITLKGYCDSKNLSGVIIYSGVNGSSIFKSNTLATSADGGSEFTYTIEKDCDALYLGRYGGGTTCLTSLQVKRPASSSGKTRLTASFERNADVVVKTTTTPTATLPTLMLKSERQLLLLIKIIL